MATLIIEEAGTTITRETKAASHNLKLKVVEVVVSNKKKARCATLYLVKREEETEYYVTLGSTSLPVPEISTNGELTDQLFNLLLREAMHNRPELTSKEARCE